MYILVDFYNDDPGDIITYIAHDPRGPFYRNMTSILSSPHVERAMSLAKLYIPESILDNWRVVGTTGIMVGLCLCPVIASAWESGAGEEEGEGDEEHDDEGYGG